MSDHATSGGSSPPGSPWIELRGLALLFLRLGVTAFGGPAAHIAMMEDEVVRRRGWLTRDEFLDLIGATNLIPGPNSTELAIHIGRRRAGFPGLLVAGASFIVPAAVLTGGFAWAYVRFGRLPEASSILYGVKPVIIAVIAQALFGLARNAVRTRRLAMLAALAVGAVLLGVNELLVLLAAGVLAALFRPPRPPEPRREAAKEEDSKPPRPGAMLQIVLPAVGGAVASAAFSLTKLFLFFAKVGAVLFGSGYVLLAFIRADLVERWHWLTEAQLLDAVAVGQVTPGPVFTTATFIGYVLGAIPGAVVATAGIFLPAFFFVAVSAPLVPRIRRSAVAGAFLDGVNVASLALMAVVSVQLARAAFVDVPTILMALASAALILRYRVNSAWLVLGGAVAGSAVRFLLPR